MVVQAAAADWVTLAQRYVFGPAKMSNTRYTSPSNPALGAGITSTPRDYAAFLRAYFTHELLPEALRAEMEIDQYPLARSVLGSWVGARRPFPTFPYSSPRPAWCHPKILVL